MSGTKELTVVNLDEFKLLPKATQTIINTLSKTLRMESLNIFNPIVESMVVIEGFKAIKYTEGDEDTIQQYKDAKAYIRTFNANTKRAKKSLKAPYLQTGKDIDAVEKAMLTDASGVQEVLDKEFDGYLNEKAEKEAEALAKKNQASTDKIKELSAENVESQLLVDRMKINSKYNEFISKIVNDTIDKIETYSTMALKMELNALDIMSLGLDLSETDQAILLDDQKAELVEKFEKAIRTSKNLVQGQINALQAEIEANAKILAEGIAEKAKPVEKEMEPIEMVAPGYSNVPNIENTPIYFEMTTALIFEYAIKEMTELKAVTDKEIRAKASMVAGMESYKNKILTFLKS